MLRRPYAARRAVLEELAFNSWPWPTTPAAGSVDVAGELRETTRRLGLEGVVAKRADAPYRPGHRSAVWLKLKHPHAHDLQLAASAGRWVAGARRATVLPAIAYD